MQTNIKSRKRGFKIAFGKDQDEHCEPPKRMKKNTSTSALPPPKHEQRIAKAPPVTSNNNGEQSDPESSHPEQSDHDSEGSDINQEVNNRRKKSSSRSQDTVTRNASNATQRDTNRLQRTMQTIATTPYVESSRHGRLRGETASQLRSRAPASIPPAPQSLPAAFYDELHYKELFKLKLESTSPWYPLQCCGCCSLWCWFRWVYRIGLWCSLIEVACGAIFMICIIASDEFEVAKEFPPGKGVVLFFGTIFIFFFLLLSWLSFTMLSALDHCMANRFLMNFWIHAILAVFSLRTAPQQSLVGLLFSLWYLWVDYKVYLWALHFENGGKWNDHDKQD